MYAKIGIIVLVVIALGAALFLFHWTSDGNITLPSWFSLPSSSFSLAPSGHAGVTLPTLSSNGTYIGPTTGYGGTTGYGTASGVTVNPATIPPSEIPAGWTVPQLSPYFHEVRFGTVSAGTSYYYGTISLYAYFADSQATGTIDITGWNIKTRESGEYIPKAIAVYDPSGLAAPSDIRMKNGDTVYLYSSSAPFNLRLNKCIGYVANVADFRPSLPSSCPQVDESRIGSFTGACQEYIQSISGCEQPSLTNPLVSRTDYACQDFLENNFNYKSCFEQHDTDPDFLSNQVWVWTGSNVVNQYHDTVDLLDSNGLLVDQYSY